MYTNRDCDRPLPTLVRKASDGGSPRVLWEREKCRYHLRNGETDDAA